MVGGFEAEHQCRALAVTDAREGHFQRVEQLIKAADHPRILRDPGPVSRLMSFEDYGMRLEARFWIRDPMNGVNNVRSDVNREIFRLFRENGVKIPVAVAMGIVGLFAIFHGHAHGSEMPMDASGVEYGLGFMLATALLHAVGIGIGFLIGMTTKWLGNNVYRAAGGLASIAGVAILLGVL